MGEIDLTIDEFRGTFPTRLLVCGPDDFGRGSKGRISLKHYGFFRQVIIREAPFIENAVILESGRTGTERMASQLGGELAEGVFTINSDWEDKGLGAKGLLNTLMVMESTHVLAFQTMSRMDVNTSDIIQKAKGRGLPVKAIYYKEDLTGYKWRLWNGEMFW